MERKLIHTSRMPIRWGDMDTMGHVNNTLYFRYMEQARIDWMASLGLPGEGTPGAPVLINASCTFLIPFTYPGNIDVLTYIAPPGRSSLQTYCELRLEGDARLYAEGAAKIVWMDPATGKSIPLPQAMRSLAQ